MTYGRNPPQFLHRPTPWSEGIQNPENGRYDGWRIGANGKREYYYNEPTQSSSDGSPYPAASTSAASEPRSYIYPTTSSQNTTGLRTSYYPTSSSQNTTGYRTSSSPTFLYAYPSSSQITTGYPPSSSQSTTGYRTSSSLTPLYSNPGGYGTSSSPNPLYSHPGEYGTSSSPNPLYSNPGGYGTSSSPNPLYSNPGEYGTSSSPTPLYSNPVPPSSQSTTGYGTSSSLNPLYSNPGEYGTSSSPTPLYSNPVPPSSQSTTGYGTSSSPTPFSSQSIGSRGCSYRKNTFAKAWSNGRINSKSNENQPNNNRKLNDLSQQLSSTCLSKTYHQQQPYPTYETYGSNDGVLKSRNTGNGGSSSSRSDSNFRVHNSTFFRPGRVFKVLWVEPLGTFSSDSTNVTLEEISQGTERAFTKLRRFVVIRGGHGHSQCLSIRTYQGQGTLKPGVAADDHVAVYTKLPSTGKLPFLPGEYLTKAPIRVIPAIPSETLDPLSRLNLVKIYTVEHNVKVADVGQIDPTHLDTLKKYVQATWELS